MHTAFASGACIPRTQAEELFCTQRSPRQADLCCHRCLTIDEGTRTDDGTAKKFLCSSV